MQQHLLIVDDEREWLDVLGAVFQQKGIRVQTAESGKEALALLEKEPFDLVLCDLAMPGLSGLDVLKRLRLDNNQVPFIIMTGVGSIKTAVESVQSGAYNYITKPFKIQELEDLARQAVEYGRMHRALREAAPPEPVPMVLGTNKALHDSLRTISKISGSKVPVLIYGETGTGKTLLAKHIHKISSRGEQAFLTIDCGALPENLLESELFGHVKGSFTGAVTTRRGLLEEAQGGTVFLDEIGELSPGMQAKLLSAVQERVIRPLGGNKSIPVDVRFITATNRDLKHEVESGTFREDLYYRLAVVSLWLPPLRERREDIVLFVTHFIHKFNMAYGKNITCVSPAAMQMLMEQPWRGNIRELENTLERAVLLAEGDTITLTDLRLYKDGTPAAGDEPGSALPLQSVRRKVEKKTIEHALAVSGGNRTQAAALLGIGRRTLYDKMSEYRIV